MTSRSTAAPRASTLNVFGYPGDKLVAYENVSVATYASGTRRASHGRLDVSSNRMTFTALSVPTEVWDCAHGTSHDLAEAAREVLEDAHQQDPLW
jgi:hypothetical protein